MEDPFSVVLKSPSNRFLFASILIGLLICGHCGYCTDVVIEPAQTFQTIAGWGHGGGVLGSTEGPDSMLPQSLADPVNYQYLNYLTDDLGLTGTRTWEVGPRIDGTRHRRW